MRSLSELRKAVKQEELFTGGKAARRITRYGGFSESRGSPGKAGKVAHPGTYSSHGQITWATKTAKSHWHHSRHTSHHVVDMHHPDTQDLVKLNSPSTPKHESAKIKAKHGIETHKVPGHLTFDAPISHPLHGSEHLQKMSDSGKRFHVLTTTWRTYPHGTGGGATIYHGAHDDLKSARGQVRDLNKQKFGLGKRAPRKSPFGN